MNRLQVSKLLLSDACVLGANGVQDMPESAVKHGLPLTTANPKQQLTASSSFCWAFTPAQGPSAPFPNLSAPDAISVTTSVHAVEGPALPLKNPSADVPGAAKPQSALKGGTPLPLLLSPGPGACPWSQSGLMKAKPTQCAQQQL
jgi:hypothetical protein